MFLMAKSVFNQERPIYEEREPEKAKGYKTYRRALNVVYKDFKKMTSFIPSKAIENYKGEKKQTNFCILFQIYFLHFDQISSIVQRWNLVFQL